MGKKFITLLSTIIVAVTAYIIFVNSAADQNYNAQIRQAWMDGRVNKVADKPVIVEKVQAAISLDSIDTDIEYSAKTISISEAPEMNSQASQSRAQSAQPSVCDAQQDVSDLRAKLIDIQLPEKYTANEAVRVKVSLMNIGSSSWYGDSYFCPSYLKTTLALHDLSAANPLFTAYDFDDNGWTLNADGAEPMVKMTEEFVKHGDIGTFVFWTNVPDEVSTIIKEKLESENLESDVEPTEIEKEYKWSYERVTLQPRLSEKEVDLKIPIILSSGDIPENMANKISFLSRFLDTFNLTEFTGEENIYVSLKDQRGYLRYGERAFHEYLISSGSWETPTPQGEHEVVNKEVTRIGGKSPHYRMPYWLGLKTDGKFIGYGLHEVPYLGESKEKSDFYQKGVKFDLGKNVSHGCVRSGPGDAELIYEFADVGTKVHVKKNGDLLYASA